MTQDPFDCVRLVAAERGVHPEDIEWLVRLAKSIYQGALELQPGEGTPIEFARWVLDGLEGETGVLAPIVEKIEREIGQKIGCRLGCTACCDYSVTAQAVEADRIAALVATMPEEKRRQIVERTREAIAKGIDQLQDAERLAVRYACPLLIDGACSVYSERPIACRAWFGLSSEKCASLTESSPFGFPALIGDTAAMAVFAANITQGADEDPGGDLISLLADRFGMIKRRPPTLDEINAKLKAAGINVDEIRKDQP